VPFYQTKKQIQKTCIKIDPQKQPINKPRLPDNSPHPVQEKTTFKAQISQNHPHFTTPKKTRTNSAPSQVPPK
jgi:hypothetical protein